MSPSSEAELFPRRADINRNTAAEMKIREAIRAVEEMGAHYHLTWAVDFLDRARHHVADYVDEIAGTTAAR